MIKRIIGFFLAVLLLFGPLESFAVSAQEAAEQTQEFLSVAEGIINWKKTDNGAASDGYLINDAFLELAASTPGDWYPIGLGRLGIKDNDDGYLAVARDRVEERYRESGKLSAAKATEWHRIALAVLAMGGDPTAFGKDETGGFIDLIADGTYNRGKTASLGRQGINGWIWGLITLDSMRYAVPAGAYYTRDDMIIEILRQQLADGGFALSGQLADPDITAMALQALAPYYNCETVYSYKQKTLGKEVSKTVRQVVEEALGCLSELQLDTGDFASWGTQNVESTDQVVVALCSLGIDPLTDTRFIKNGNTLLDGILRYRMQDGGFIHSFTYDSDNPSSLPDESNTMAGEQTLYTMAALWRQASGMRTLYDFRPEQSAVLKERISALESRIAGLNVSASEEALEGLLLSFYSLPEGERNYVHNYWVLSDLAKAAGIDIHKIADTATVEEDPAGENTETAILYFSASDRKEVDSLPERLTTEQYVLVTALLSKLQQSEDFGEKAAYLEKLIEAKGKIAAVQAEIDGINADIKEKMYPFTEMTLKDKSTVDDIIKRYEALSEYDRAKIRRWEDVIKTKTLLDNRLRGIVIAVVLTVAAAVLAVWLVKHIKKQRRRKELEMEELAAQYSGEEECE